MRDDLIGPRDYPEELPEDPTAKYHIPEGNDE